MTDPLLCMTDKILRALPSEESFSIFQFILSWNKGRILLEITQAEFGYVRELLDRFLSSLAIKSFRINPVFTQYILSYHCQVCGDSADHL